MICSSAEVLKWRTITKFRTASSLSCKILKPENPYSDLQRDRSKIWVHVPCSTVSWNTVKHVQKYNLSKTSKNILRNNCYTHGKDFLAEGKLAFRREKTALPQFKYERSWSWKWFWNHSLTVIHEKSKRNCGRNRDTIPQIKPSAGSDHMYKGGRHIS